MCGRTALVSMLLSLSVMAVAAAQTPIRIGASVSQTGSFALLGQKLLRGYQLCVKHTNEKGGVLGRGLELVAEDDRSEPATAVRIYEKLITQTERRHHERGGAWWRPWAAREGARGT